jgi:UDP-galactopyranose mutase
MVTIFRGRLLESSASDHFTPFRMLDYDVLIVGSGLSGAVIANRYASELNKKVLVIEKRDHLGGNCYDFIDEKTNILMNKYGAHLFHTNSDKVWEFINKFSKWIRWDHQVLGLIENKLVPIPVNINTVNSLCSQNIKDSPNMDEWLANTQIKYDTITNSEEMGKSRVGSELYEKIFKDYTFKQWNKFPEELDPSVLARIPIRNNFDNRYFDDKYQALPELGYTKFIENIFNHDNITVKLNIDFFEFKKQNDLTDKIIIYTGPIDYYFNNTDLEKLEYRSIDFIKEYHYNTNFYQQSSVVNYPEIKYPFTRIVEYKHFLNQKSDHTIIVKETTNDIGEPYYPIPNQRNMELYNKYKELAEQETNVHFIGRLASYKYFNMDQAILNALDYFDKHLIK